ncbi:MAG: hypothetical protein M9909_01225 [Thermomicrobiales bacterium]|nr:hypothetical protein [Thermomicrobiales bacterium]
MFTTEWPRIREVETERFLMDAHFMFYELAPLAYEGKIWGVRPDLNPPAHDSGFLQLAGDAGAFRQPGDTDL